MAPRRRKHPRLLGMLGGLYPEKVSVLATLANSLVDRDMTVDAARQLWVDLCQQGWRRVAEQDLRACRMSHRRLREIAYER